MTEYENLKRSYIATIQFGLSANVKYDEVKHGNDLLHKFCEQLIENSNYSDMDKQSMKHDLEIVKEALSQEIKTYWRNKR